jgi:hypothetical protein
MNSQLFCFKPETEHGLTNTFYRFENQSIIHGESISQLNYFLFIFV